MADFTQLSDEELLKQLQTYKGKGKRKRSPTGVNPSFEAWKTRKGEQIKTIKDIAAGGVGNVQKAVQAVTDLRASTDEWRLGNRQWLMTGKREGRPDRKPTTQQLMRQTITESKQRRSSLKDELKRREGLSPEETEKERLERALNKVKTPNVNTPRETVNTDNRGKTNQPLNVDEKMGPFLSSTYGSLGKPDPNSPFALENNPWGLLDSSKTPNQPLNKQTPKLSKEEWLAEQGTAWEQKTANSPAAQSGAWETPGERWDIQKKARSKSWDKKYEAYLKKDETPELEKAELEAKRKSVDTSATNLTKMDIAKKVGGNILGQTDVGKIYNAIETGKKLIEAQKAAAAAKAAGAAGAGAGAGVGAAGAGATAGATAGGAAQAAAAFNPAIAIAALAINAVNNATKKEGSPNLRYQGIQPEEYWV